MRSIRELRNIAKEVRRDVVEMVYRAGSGHLAGSLSVVDLLVALFFGGVIERGKKGEKGKRRDREDRFILSAGHYCPALYSALSRLGYFDRKLLWALRDLGSPLQGHPHRGSLPGIELSTGALGQGLSVGVGKALALRLKCQMSNVKRQTLPFVFVLMSDGEQNEGQVWEAVMAASKYKLDNLVVVIDKNGIQSTGDTVEVMPLGDLKRKYKAFGWEAKTIGGNEIGEIIKMIGKIRDNKGTKNPRAVIAQTMAGKGVSFLENDFRWHAKPIGEEEYRKALEELA